MELTRGLKEFSAEEKVLVSPGKIKFAVNSDQEFSSSGIWWDKETFVTLNTSVYLVRPDTDQILFTWSVGDDFICTAKIDRINTSF